MYLSLNSSVIFHLLNLNLNLKFENEIFFKIIISNIDCKYCTIYQLLIGNFQDNFRKVIAKIIADPPLFDCR